MRDFKSGIKTNALQLTAGSPGVGKVATSDADGNVSWSAPSSGSGDVSAAEAFTNDNRVIRSDGTGKMVQASNITLDDTGNLAGLNNITVNGELAGDVVVGNTSLNGPETFTQNLYTGTINEITTGSGVTIDGVLLKDGLTDGRDVSADGTKLDGIEAGADVTDAANVTAAGAIMDGDFTANGSMHRTAAGTYAARTITGTTNLITVTNGDGVAGNPTITVGTNVYRSGGTDVAVADGGTGRSTSTTAYGIIAAGTTATGAQQTISPGTSGQFLKSAGASALAAFASLTSADITSWADNAVPGNALALTAITLAQQSTTTNVAVTNTTVASTAFGATVTIPTGGRRVKISAYFPYVSAASASVLLVSFWDGTVGTGTQLQQGRLKLIDAADQTGMFVEWRGTPAAGSKTYNMGVYKSGGDVTINNSSTAPSFFTIELL